MTADTHPTWGAMCCICFEGLTPETAAVDKNGVKWDVCRGVCASQVYGHEDFPDEMKAPAPHRTADTDEPTPATPAHVGSSNEATSPVRDGGS